MNSPEAARAALMAIGREFHQRGWSLATSSNYSVVVGRDPLRLVLTGSGFDKGRLTPADFVELDRDGGRVDAEVPGGPRPSAEARLHVVLARTAGAGAVLHTHSVWGTVWSEAVVARGHLRLQGYEMLKALPGVTTHEAVVDLPVYANTQDIAGLAARIEARWAAPTPGLPPAFLMAGHGLYAWGRDLAEARRHVEAVEFLLEVLGRKAALHGGWNPGDPDHGLDTHS
jgi:methylthioribulose-1-phosphate dehydratase